MSACLSIFKKLSKQSLAAKATKKALFLLSAFLVAGGLIGGYLYFLAKPAAAAWFNENWLYRKAITVTVASSSSDITDLETLITVDTSASGKFQSSCQDLRFTNQGGKILPYYIDSGCGTSSTKVWVMVDLVPKNTTTYTMYMYYGNPSAPATSDSHKFRLFNGLVGYWKMNESSWNGTSGEVKDNSVNGNNGVRAGDATTTASGKYSYAGTFDGNGDYVDAGNVTAANGLSQITVSAWIYSSNFAQYGFIVDKDPVNTVWELFLENGASNEGQAGLKWRGGSATGIVTDFPTNNQWHHVVATQNGTSATIYLDGVAKVTGTVAALGTSSNSVNIGRYGGETPSSWFNGQIDDVRVYNRALSADEISQLYQNPGNIASNANATTNPSLAIASEEAGPGPVAYWKFDDGQGYAAKNTSWQKTGTTTNLITNPSFETGLTTWQNSGTNVPTSIQNTANSLFGSASAKVTYSGSNSQFIFPMISSKSALNGVPWVWSAWVKTSNANSVYVAMQTENASQNSYYSSNHSGNGTWQRLSVSGTTTFDQGGTTGYISFTVGSNDNGSVAYIDGAQLEIGSTSNTPYCDGSLTGNGQHSWSGTAHASTSTCDYGNDGQIIGATWQTEDRCVAGKCLYFDGTDDIVSVTDNPALDMGTHDFTISAWIRHTPTLTASWDSAIVEKITATDGYRFTIRETEAGSSAGKLLLSLRTSSADTEITSNTALNDGKWHHVVAAADRDGNVTFYVDGKSDGGGSIAARSASLDNTGDLRIGLTNAYFKGNMDEIKIYPYLRSAAQIKTDYLAGKAAASTHSGTGSALGSQPQDWLSNGLVGYWKMDESTISIVDSSGNNQTTTPTGGAMSAGKFGNSLDLNGTSSDYVVVTDANSLDFTTQFTFSTWIYRDADSGGYERIASKDNSGATDFYWYFQVTDNDKIQLGTNEGGNSYSLGNTSISTGQWYHVVGVYDGTQASANDRFKIFVNGVSDKASDSGTHPTTLVATTGNLNFGRLYQGGWNYGLNGKMDDVRIYNRALSPREVSDLYNWAPGPVGYWNFEDGNGGTVTDRSGNANNGTWAGTGATHWTTGKYGKAGKFNGSDDYVGTSYTHNYTSGITLSGWFRTSTTGSANYALFGDSFGSTVAGTGIYYQGSGTNLQFDGNTASGTNWNISCTTTGLNDNKWHYVAATWDGTTTANKVVCYIDGVQKNTGTATSTITTATGVTNIGRNRNDNNLFFPGSIDDVRIYNYARTQKQIVQDMNAGHPAVGSPVGSAIGHWKFDEGQGQTANNSGSQGSTLNGTRGADSSSSTDDPSWTDSGKFGKALSFDGGDYVNVPNNAVLNATGDMTLSAWIKMSDISDYRYIFNKDQWTDSSNNAGYNMVILSSGSGLGGKIQIDFRNNSLNNLNSNGTVNDNNWHHIVATFQAGVAQKIYIDGKLDNSTTSVPSSLGTTTNPLNIGRQYRGADQYFSGTIDEPKVYNYALTADEVKLDYNRGSSLVLGSLGDNSTYQKGAANQEYCVPGDSTSCAAPVAKWDFEEGSGGSVNDTSGNANTGTWNGTGSHWITGKAGKAGKFNGSDDYVDAGTTLAPSTGLTIESWVKTSSLSQEGPYLIAGKNNKFELELWGGSYNKFILGVATANNGWEAGISLAQMPTTVTTNTWYHVVGTYDTAGTTKFYINGQLAATSTTTSGNLLSTAGETFFIGKRGSLYFNGLIDGVRVFNYARSAAQVAYDYNRGAPVGWWKFDECQGSTAHDSTLNANHGTITIGASGSQASLGTCTANAATAWYNGRTGKRNYSLNFDGTDDYVSNADPSVGVLDFGANQDFSLSAWIKTTQNPTGSNWPMIIRKDDEGTPRNGRNLYLEPNSGGKVSFDTFVSGTYSIVTSNRTVNDGNWHHVLAVRNDTNYRIYIDGVLDKTGTGSSGSIATSTNQLIGGGVSAIYFNGQIDDLRVYNYALTPTQVKNLYNCNAAVCWGPSTGAP